MANSVDAATAEWIKRVDKKVSQISSATDKAVVKAAFYCEGEAKKNAMTMIYSVSVPNGPDGKALWKRTGVYKASIGSGLDPGRFHRAIVFNTAPYAQKIEYGTSDAYGAENPGRQGRPVMTNSVFNHKDDIKQIIATYLKAVVK